jgi:nickel/cobalt transporter (NicO) family protein
VNLRPVRWLLVAAGAGMAMVLALPAQPASAHPLGNFSVNQYQALTLHRDRIDVHAVVDTAELPTLQERSTVDVSDDGIVSDTERAAFAARTCQDVAHAFAVSVDARRLVWTVGPVDYVYAPGAAGLSTSRLSCKLSTRAALDRPAMVQVANSYRADRIGWREMVAIGDRVRLVDPPIPSRSVSEELRHYPTDLLSSPLNVRSAVLRTEPSSVAAMSTQDSGFPGGAPGGFAPTATGWTAGAEARLRSIVGSHGLTPLVGVLAVLLSILLGAGHAALPGHGKTVMAAYLAGKRGRWRDAAAVGATVTLTHTGAVLVLGLLLTSVAGLAGESVLSWLGLASGVLVVAVGAGMLAAVRRNRRRHDHNDHDHGHSHEHGHTHEPGHAHEHEDTRPGRWGIAGIGIAGGLVPSPSALVVLLGAIGLGRTGFGILLVVAYGLGMAAALTAAGLLLVRLQHRWHHRTGTGRPARLPRIVARLSTVARPATALLVVLVGASLAARAAAGLI